MYRVEFERLIELLRSRTVNLPKDHENKRTEPSISQLVAAQARDEQLIPAQENRGESRISTPTGGFLVGKLSFSSLFKFIVHTLSCFVHVCMFLFWKDAEFLGKLTKRTVEF